MCFYVYSKYLILKNRKKYPSKGIKNRSKDVDIQLYNKLNNCGNYVLNKNIITNFGVN